MDNSDDETLLDWEQYAGMRKFKCWGLDCSLVARFCPFMPWVPPEWYYRWISPLPTISAMTAPGLSSKCMIASRKRSQPSILSSAGTHGGRGG